MLNLLHWPGEKVHLHTHLYEGDRSIIKERFGKTSLEWCHEIGFTGHDVWIAHGWEIEKDEYSFMAETGTGISHCHAPAVFGGFPILDIKALSNTGILVSLGVDGSATNDSSNLLNSLRMGYIMQAYFSKNRSGCVSPSDMLKVATINGAGTLGRKDLGSLEAGKAADLFMIDTNVPELTGTLHDPKNLLASVGVTGPVWMTMINGKVIYENGHLTGVDEQSLSEKGEKICTKVNRL